MLKQAKPPDVSIWTDGSNDKQGHGGAAAVCVAANGKRHIETYGEMSGATNQTMELMAAIIGLKRLWWDADPLKAARKRSKKTIVIYSDSAYLVNCFNDDWIASWVQRSWRKGDGKPVANRALWETLEALVVEYKVVKFVLIKGHAGNVNNELADRHANMARVAMVGREQNVKRLVRAGRIDEVAPDSRPQRRSGPRRHRPKSRRGS
jgi:ribonuclease HI